jgi:hypothetical protein
VARFLPGGHYDGAIAAGRVGEYIVLDFCQSHPSAVKCEFIFFTFYAFSLYMVLALGLSFKTGPFLLLPVVALPSFIWSLSARFRKSAEK